MEIIYVWLNRSNRVFGLLLTVVYFNSVNCLPPCVWRGHFARTRLFLHSIVLLRSSWGTTAIAVIAARIAVFILATRARAMTIGFLQVDTASVKIFAV